MFSITKTKIAASAVLLAGVIASAASGAECLIAARKAVFATFC
jgi:hypothetical protein